MKATLLAILLLTLCAPAWAAPRCAPATSLEKRVGLIQDSITYGRASGVLLDSKHVLTNNTALKNIRDLSVYLPRIGRSITATVVMQSLQPDMALLELEEEITDVAPLKLASSYSNGTRMLFVSFVLNRKNRLGSATARYNDPVRYSGDKRTLYFNAEVSDWAMAGDVGGSFFNCDGELVGLAYNPNTVDAPAFVYAIGARGIRHFMEKTQENDKEAEDNPWQ